MAAKKKISFEQFYNDIYEERWPALKDALLQSASSFCIDQAAGLLKPYYLDRASAAAAAALDVHPGDQVLDMCAAPGGKTLLLALALNGSGRLISNDRSSDRRRRLKDVIDSHLPEKLQQIITVTGHDSTRWGLFEQNVYDRILLDAPCSSEEHVLKSPAHLNKWSPARTKQLAVQAHAMLAAAVEAVKPGGTILYSTCSLSPLENDGVIAKLLKKRGEMVSVDYNLKLTGLHSDSLTADQTEYGLHILPDKNDGFGPIFMTRLIKNPPDQKTFI